MSFIFNEPKDYIHAACGNGGNKIILLNSCPLFINSVVSNRVSASES
jgi:hypothetical protein